MSSRRKNIWWRWILVASSVCVCKRSVWNRGELKFFLYYQKLSPTKHVFGYNLVNFEVSVTNHVLGTYNLWVWVADWHTFYVEALVRPFWPFRPWKLKIRTHMNFHFPVTLKSWKNYENLNFFHIRPLFWPSKIFWPFFNFSGLLTLFVVVISENWVNFAG